MSESRSGVSAEAVKQRIGQAIHGYACGCERPWPMNANYDEMVEAVLESLGSFDTLTWIAQQLLDLHYPADLPLVCDRNSPDPGPRLVAALRDCLEARSGASQPATAPAPGTAGADAGELTPRGPTGGPR